MQTHGGSTELLFSQNDFFFSQIQRFFALRIY